MEWCAELGDESAALLSLLRYAEERGVEVFVLKGWRWALGSLVADKNAIALVRGAHINTQRHQTLSKLLKCTVRAN